MLLLMPFGTLLRRRDKGDPHRKKAGPEQPAVQFKPANLFVP
jgi:hypothetical protein